MSNLPPGVTGNEYEIAGPDYEDEAVRYCPKCDEETEGTIEGYDRSAWFRCGVCNNTTDFQADEPDGDRQRDERIERELDRRYD